MMNLRQTANFLNYKQMTMKKRNETKMIDTYHHSFSGHNDVTLKRQYSLLGIPSISGFMYFLQAETTIKLLMRS